MYCATCDILEGIVVDHTGDFRFKNLDASSQFGCCSKCKGQNLTKWSFGQPCPRCAGAIEKTGEWLLGD